MRSGQRQNLLIDRSGGALWRCVGVAGLLVCARLAPLPVNGCVAGMPSLCPFHALTGLPCPGCGMTRSVICLMHGHLHDAVYFHPLGPVAAIALIAWAAFGLVQPNKDADAEHSRTAMRFAAALSLVVVTVVWCARLAHLLPGP